MGCRTVRGILAAAPRESEFFSLRAAPFDMENHFNILGDLP